MTLHAIVPSAIFADHLPTPRGDYRWHVWALDAPPPAGLDIERVRLAVINGHGSGERLRRLKDLPSLEVVQVTGIGYEFAHEHVPPGVALCNAAGVNEDFTAELAVTITMASMRELPYFLDLQRARNWVTESASRPGPRGMTLVGKNVLVLGAGAVGRGIATRMRALGCLVTVLARTARAEHDEVHGIDELDGLLPSADIVLIAVPLTSSTRGLVDGPFLDRMKPGALIVNVGRGAVVDTDALVTALSQGRVRAALDVTDPEPLPSDHPLWSCPGVIVTPHVAGVSDQTWSRLITLLDDQAARLAAGLAPHNVVAADSRALS